MRCTANSTNIYVSLDDIKFISDARKLRRCQEYESIKSLGKVRLQYIIRHDKNDQCVGKYIIKFCHRHLFVLFVGVIRPYHCTFTNAVELLFSCFVRNKFLTQTAFKFVLLEQLHVASNWDFRLVRKIKKKGFSFFMSLCPSVRSSVRLSVRLPAWNDVALTGRIFMKFDIWLIFETLPRKFSLKSDENNGYFTWRTVYIFDHILLSSS